MLPVRTISPVEHRSAYELSALETERHARAAGCSVLRTHDLGDGVRAWDLDCHEHGNKVALLEELAESEAQLPGIRRLAEDVTAGATTDAERAADLLGYVQNHVSFAGELRETFNGVARTLEIGQGDCDDSARALLALLRSLAIPARLETLPARATGRPPHHVAAQVQLGGAWHWLETTVRAEPGEHPLDAARRLGVQTRPDLGAIGAAADLPLLDRAVEWLAVPIVLGTAGVLWWMSG